MAMGERSGVDGGVERRGAAPARYAGEAHRGGGSDEEGTDGYFQKELWRTRENGAGAS
jgi:hypothetical protein